MEREPRILCVRLYLRTAADAASHESTGALLLRNDARPSKPFLNVAFLGDVEIAVKLVTVFLGKFTDDSFEVWFHVLFSRLIRRYSDYVPTRCLNLFPCLKLGNLSSTKNQLHAQ